MSLVDPMLTVQADFDRLALLADEGRDHSSHYHKFLLRSVPPHCREALEIGCGTGAFSRLLAGRSEHLLALDLSSQMIWVAQERSRQFSNIDFERADVNAYELPAGRFDCIASIATLHHLPVVEALSRIKTALKPGGVLIVLDLFQPAGLADLMMSVAAKPVSMGLRLVKRRTIRASREVREAWAEHARHDVYPTMAQIRRISWEILPGAEVRRHLLWRYSILWKK